MIRRMLRIELLPPRVYVLNHRIHHGFLGLVLMLHDRHDWRVWLSDFRKAGAR